MEAVGGHIAAYTETSVPFCSKDTGVLLQDRGTFPIPASLTSPSPPCPPVPSIWQRSAHQPAAPLSHGKRLVAIQMIYLLKQACVLPEPFPKQKVSRLSQPLLVSFSLPCKLCRTRSSNPALTQQARSVSASCLSFGCSLCSRQIFLVPSTLGNANNM